MTVLFSQSLVWNSWHVFKVKGDIIITTVTIKPINRFLYIFKPRWWNLVILKMSNKFIISVGEVFKSCWSFFWKGCSFSLFYYWFWFLYVFCMLCCQLKRDRSSIFVFSWFIERILYTIGVFWGCQGNIIL